jgi:uncharacterized radical SAM superfamily Fe-S cluster-containing enzyme
MRRATERREMQNSGLCYCPISARDVVGRIVVDEHVWLVRQTPEYGLIKTILFNSPAFFVEAKNSAGGFSPAPRHTALVVEITERCDVGCATCSASSTLIGNDLDAYNLVTSTIERAHSIGADVVALSGGEPLMRDDLWNIVDALHQSIPKIVIITSGRGFEKSPTILENIAARAEWLEIYLQFDSLRNDVLQALRTPVMTASIRRERLALAVGTGAATTAVCVVPPDSTEDEIGELALFCRNAGAKGVTFQPLRQLGRHPTRSVANGPMSTIDHIQMCALEALGVEHPQPMPFAQQPFDMTVAFVSGTRAISGSRFFLAGRHTQGFRVATSSYWDKTNYFAPFASSTRFYFYVADGKPLNDHYFSSFIQEASRSLYDRVSEPSSL